MYLYSDQIWQDATEKEQLYMLEKTAERFMEEAKEFRVSLMESRPRMKDLDPLVSKKLYKELRSLSITLAGFLNTHFESHRLDADLPDTKEDKLDHYSVLDYRKI